MKKWIGLCLTLILFTFFLLGCAGTSTDTKIRCPKCGSFYNSKQGAETFEWMHGPGQ